MTRTVSFMANRAAVTRPFFVRPTMNGPSHRKCQSHLCQRGWKRRTSLVRDVRRSIPAKFGPLWRLQRRQAYARLPRTVVPRCCWAMICSISKLSVKADSGIRQYSQRKKARARMAATRRSSMTANPGRRLLQPLPRFRLKDGQKVAHLDVVVQLGQFDRSQLSVLISGGQIVHALPIALGELQIQDVLGQFRRQSILVRIPDARKNGRLTGLEVGNVG